MAETGITLDTGALIALERGEKRMRTVLKTALHREAIVTVPAVVVLEWWRGGNLQRDMLKQLRVEPTTVRLAQIAGYALARVRGATAIDAAVMASAAQRGDVVYTSDVEDLERLGAHFRSVRVLGVSGRME